MIDYGLMTPRSQLLMMFDPEFPEDMPMVGTPSGDEFLGWCDTKDPAWLTVNLFEMLLTGTLEQQKAAAFGLRYLGVWTQPLSNGWRIDIEKDRTLALKNP